MNMVNHFTFLLDLSSPRLEILRIIRPICLLVMKGDHIRRIGKQIIHLLERQTLCLRQEYPEKYCVGKVTDDEEEVILVADIGHCHIGDLAD